MFFEKNENSILLSVKLTPKAANAAIKGTTLDDKENEFLKISVVSPPEKGRANEELIKIIAQKLNITKSSIKIVSGEASRYKKLKIIEVSETTCHQLEEWRNEFDSKNY